MRIAYFVVWNESGPGSAYRGVFSKIADQINMWRVLGCESELFILTHRECMLAGWAKTVSEFPVHVLTHTSRIGQFAKASVLAKEILGWQPDIIYVRYALYLPALQYLARRVPMVMEVNTDNLTEFQLRSGVRYWYHRITQRWWVKYLSGIVYVSEELSRRPYFSRYEIPSVVIGNGIDLDRYATLPPPNNRQPCLVFIGAKNYPWHGVEQILRMANQWPDWQFDLIGSVLDETGEPLPKNVRTHGLLTREQYEGIFAQADIGIGTLGLYAKKMSEASPLKVREYLAYGIPTIIGYLDTDFPGSAPFLLRLPNSPDNVDCNMEAIAQFVYSWKGKRVPREQVAHLDVKVKERQRMGFFRRVIVGANGSAE